MNGRGEVTTQAGRRGRCVAAALLLAPLAGAVVALSATAAAAVSPTLPPLPSPRPSSPPTSSPPTAGFAPPATSPTSVTLRHRTSPSATHRYRSSSYRPPSTQSTGAPYSVSESTTGGPTQSFLLGSASLGSLSSSSPPVVTPSPTAGSSSRDDTGRYVHVFFAVIVVAALLLAAGITGLVLTRDGRYPGGKHR